MIRFAPTVLFFVIFLCDVGIYSQEKTPSDGLTEKETQKLRNLRMRYGFGLLKITEDQWISPMERLRNGYQKRLEQIQNSFSQAGDLTKALAAKKAAAIYPDWETVSPDIKEISAAQTTFLNAQKELRKRRRESHANLTQSHVAELTAIKIKLTKLGRLGGALVLEQAIKNLASNPQITPTSPDTSQGQANSNSAPPPPGFSEVIGGALPPNSWAGAQRVNAFYIGKTELTWAHWNKINSWAALNDYDIEKVGQGLGDRYPVTNVTWHQALKWCNAASEKEGLRPVYRVRTLVYRHGISVPTVDKTANGYRLPTEKEWEFAARGGQSTDNFQYSGSNNADEVAWYLDNSEGRVHEVATKQPNQLGLYDMSGNAWEWCFDIYSVSPNYNRIPPHAQVGVLRPGDRVGRGGHRGNYVNYCSVGNSYYSTPTKTDSFRGFRVARNLLPTN